MQFLGPALKVKKEYVCGFAPSANLSGLNLSGSGYTSGSRWIALAHIIISVPLGMIMPSVIMCEYWNGIRIICMDAEIIWSIISDCSQIKTWIEGFRYIYNKISYFSNIRFIQKRLQRFNFNWTIVYFSICIFIK